MKEAPIRFLELDHPVEIRSMERINLDREVYSIVRVSCHQFGPIIWKHKQNTIDRNTRRSMKPISEQDSDSNHYTA